MGTPWYCGTHHIFDIFLFNAGESWFYRMPCTQTSIVPATPLLQIRFFNEINQELDSDILRMPSIDPELSRSRTKRVDMLDKDIL